MATALVVLIALLAGTLGGVIGTGSSIILLPFLVMFYGPQAAIPIMAIAAVMANVGRVAAWFREINWRYVVFYSGGAIPGTALGARTLLSLHPAAVDAFLGLFFLVMIPGRRHLRKIAYRPQMLHLTLLGCCIGFLTGIVASVGPLSVTVFLSLGLSKGAILATEAATSLVVYTSKVTTFSALGAVGGETIGLGLATGTMLIAGAFLGKEIVMRITAHHFDRLLEVVMMISGIALLVIAWTQIA